MTLETGPCVALPVSDSLIDAMVESRLQKKHVGWHWQLNDDAAARKMLTANERLIPQAAVEALVESRQAIRDGERQQVVAFCFELKKAAETEAADEKRRQRMADDSQ